MRFRRALFLKAQAIIARGFGLVSDPTFSELASIISGVDDTKCLSPGYESEATSLLTTSRLLGRPAQINTR